MGQARYVDLLTRLDRARALGVELGLDHVRQALARLGDPQRRFAAVQLAGTNGKGSTAAMTECLLARAGARTALYTSPHLCRFTERIRIAGREADGDRLAALDRRVEATGVPLTYFEIATVLAFLLAAEEGVDVAVLETGLGGRLDAVTAAEPLAVAITSIGLDHMDYLGPTLRHIAREKAGVIKPGIPVFLGPVPADADEEIARAAAAAGAPLARVGRDLALPEGPLGLAGPHQRENAALALALAGAAAAHLHLSLDDRIRAEALAAVWWPGRMERVRPDVLLDGAHNVDGARALAAALAKDARPVVFLLSIVGDKDARGILQALAPAGAALVATRSTNPRALTPEALATLARDAFADVSVAPDPIAGLEAARRRAGDGGQVVVCGSMFLVGALRAHLLGEPVDPVVTADPV